MNSSQCLSGVPHTVISLSGVYEASFLKGEERTAFLDYKDLSGTGFFCDDEAAAVLREAVGKRPVSGMHFIDSGDYHYLSLFFLERIREPFGLLMLDHHSDMQESVFGGDVLSCGSWLLQALKKLEFLRKVILIGGEEGGLETRFVSENRLLHIPEAALADSGGLLSREFASLPFYVSFDKDILGEPYVSTGWSQGSLTPEQAVSLITRCAEKTRLLGIDLCGEEVRKERAGEGITPEFQKNEALNRFLFRSFDGLFRQDPEL